MSLVQKILESAEILNFETGRHRIAGNRGRCTFLKLHRENPTIRCGASFSQKRILLSVIPAGLPRASRRLTSRMLASNRPLRPKPFLAGWAKKTWNH
jgi:hypothetical protein